MSSWFHTFTLSRRPRVSRLSSIKAPCRPRVHRKKRDEELVHKGRRDTHLLTSLRQGTGVRVLPNILVRGKEGQEGERREGRTGREGERRWPVVRIKTRGRVGEKKVTRGRRRKNGRGREERKRGGHVKRKRKGSRKVVIENRKERGGKEGAK